ncbi:class I SAM-dependent RNA methyltransferase [Marinoscillum sp. 108]|uniref:THUMP domain-containing class I SAM-dependent RNA methyltransferase n=1 Tax=Marinoscillum sp. 108 TaxID=2653151 RepID=UPI0012F138EB|nr:THUMP domain-containing protein [Marinoscillum sp. 108]VXD13651.1 RNA methyltransferase [Marinoscillum sp. 108]
MKIHIKTLFGLEEILAEEVRKIGGQNVEVQKRSVSCEGDMHFLYSANLNLRTALKVLVPVYNFTARTEQQLYDQVMRHDWSKYLNINQTFAIDNTVFSEFFRHSQYAALKTKDAIVDQFRNRTGKRPSVDIKTPDIQFDLYGFKDQFTISLDSSGDTLNRRGYREPGHEAPLNEVLGAGLLHLAGWNKSIPLIDPMCGTGTILIEAAMMGQNIPPQINRHDFGFKNWSNFHPTVWNQVVSEAKAGIRKAQLNITGGDIDGDAVLMVNKSLRKFKLSDSVTVTRQDVRDHRPKTPDGMIISNPPYGERIGRENTNDFYKSIGDVLKNNFTGFDAWLMSSNMEAFKHIKLRASKKIVLFNGPLECKFQKYEMYRGSKEEAK